MNSIFIIAHAPLASSLRDVALHVFPDATAHIVALDVASHSTAQTTLEQAQALLAKLVEAKQKANNTTAAPGILILTDVVGATPSNIALKLIDSQTYHAKLVAGVNVPMLLRTMTYRQESIEQLAARAVTGGIQGVVAVATTAPQHQSLKLHDQNQHDHQQ
jgi:mannose PTS system EIIA component